MRTIQLQILYLIPKFNFNPRGKERTEYGPENFRTVAQCGIRSRRVIDKTKNSTMNNFVSNGILIKKKKTKVWSSHLQKETKNIKTCWTDSLCWNLGHWSRKKRTEELAENQQADSRAMKILDPRVSILDHRLKNWVHLPIIGFASFTFRDTLSWTLSLSSTFYFWRHYGSCHYPSCVSFQSDLPWKSISTTTRWQSP